MLPLQQGLSSWILLLILYVWNTLKQEVKAIKEKKSIPKSNQDICWLLLKTFEHLFSRHCTKENLRWALRQIHQQPKNITPPPPSDGRLKWMTGEGTRVYICTNVTGTCFTDIPLHWMWLKSYYKYGVSFFSKYTRTWTLRLLSRSLIFQNVFGEKLSKHIIWATYKSHNKTKGRTVHFHGFEQKSFRTLGNVFMGVCCFLFVLYAEERGWIADNKNKSISQTFHNIKYNL